MITSSKLLKASLRLLVFLGILQFLIIEAHDSEDGATRLSTRAIGVLRNDGVAGNMNLDLVEALNMGKKKNRVLLSKFELKYIIRRRVPNGPDPIHNRGSGNSHQPPGHA